MRILLLIWCPSVNTTQWEKWLGCCCCCWFLFKGYKWIVSLFIGLKWLITFQFIWLGKRAMSLVSISYELQSHSVHKYTTTNNTWTDEQMNVIHLTNWLASSHSSVFGLCDSLNNECNAIAPSRINAKKKQQSKQQQHQLLAIKINTFHLQMIMLCKQCTDPLVLCYSFSIVSIIVSISVGSVCLLHAFDAFN